MITKLNSPKAPQVDIASPWMTAQVLQVQSRLGGMSARGRRMMYGGNYSGTWGDF
jgi:hypothetical protein